MKDTWQKSIRRIAIILLAVGISSCAEISDWTDHKTNVSAPNTSTLDSKIAVQRVVSPLGIEAWLVEESSIPIISLELSFEGGARTDPFGKEGLSFLVAGLLDEGAGQYSSSEFRSLLEENSIGLSFQTGRESFGGSLTTLSSNRDLAFDLLRLALTRPRFDDEPVNRVRSQVAVIQRRAISSPGQLASDTLYAELFNSQTYGRKTIGTTQSLSAITNTNLAAYVKEHLVRDRLKIAVVGDIDAETLAVKLDKMFGDLPASSTSAVADEISVSSGGSLNIVSFDNPQSTVLFAANGIKIDDPDFMPAYALNYVLGGGGFSSRLMQEVREKRGLTYGISTFFVPSNNFGMFIGSVASDNEKIAETIEVTKFEIDRMKREGITKEELANAKTYLTGAFALRFDSNAKIAGQLLGYQQYGLGIDYINRRNGLIEAITMDDIARALQRLPASNELSFVVVGKPKGLTSTTEAH